MPQTWCDTNNLTCSKAFYFFRSLCGKNKLQDFISKKCHKDEETDQIENVVAFFIKSECIFVLSDAPNYILNFGCDCFKLVFQM